VSSEPTPTVESPYEKLLKTNPKEMASLRRLMIVVDDKPMQLAARVLILTHYDKQRDQVTNQRMWSVRKGQGMIQVQCDGSRSYVIHYNANAPAESLVEKLAGQKRGAFFLCRLSGGRNG
jgi:hypothetical protein